MDFQVRISEPALADLEEILEYSWWNLPGSSERFGRELLDHIFMLGRFPYLGKRVPRRRNVRVMVHTPVRVYYMIQKNPNFVEILGVRNSRRGSHQKDD